MNCIFLSSFKGQYLLLHKACVQVFLLWWILEWPSFIFSGCDLAQPWSCLLPLVTPGVCLFIQSTKMKVTKLLKKQTNEKKSLLLLSDCWPWKHSDSFDTGGINYCMSAYVSNTYNKWVRLIVIFSCSGASIFKVL